MAERRERWIRKAYSLAYFIHGDPELAARVAIEALSKLDLAARAQAKRKYYRPIGRRAEGGRRTRPARSKVVMNRGQLLQRLVLIESDRFERQRERDGNLDQPAMLVHFLKHLARISARRNSLYVTVAIGRLLHGYPTSACMDLLSVVLQDPDRVPDDSYFRMVKKTLMEELQDRFPSLRTVESARGEKRFEDAEDTPRYRALVRACREQFTPWSTECLVPEGFTPLEEALPALTFDGGNPDDEHPREMSRMHALIHPACFERLAGGLGLRRPGDRLHLPRFDAAGDGGSGTADREAPDLSAPDLAAIGRALERRRRGLRAGGGRLFALAVDGREVARWNRGASASVEVELPRDPEIVEAWAIEAGERLPVAVSVLAPHPAGGPWQGEALDLALGAGSRIAVDVVPAPRPGAPGRCRLSAVCTPGLVARLASRLGGGPRRARRRAAWASALALALVGGLALYLGRPDAPPPTAPTATGPAAGAPTRGANGPWQPVPLPEIRTLFVDSPSDSPGAARLREALRRRIGAGDRFALAARRQDADALLVTAAADGGGVSLRLLNAAGEELWSFASIERDPEALAETAVADLVERARTP